MVERNAVYEAAAELLRRGEQPSVRRVTALLPTGGSPNQVAPLLKEYFESRKDDVVDDPPAFVVRLYEDFLTRIWIAARTEAIRSLEGERLRIAAIDGRLIELETMLGEKENRVAELCEQRDAVLAEIDHERRERLHAEKRAAELVGELAAERRARHDTDVTVMRLLRQNNGMDPEHPDTVGHWLEFGRAAKQILVEAGRPLTAQGIIDALDEQFRERFLKQLESNQRSKVRQFLNRRAKSGTWLVRLEPERRGGTTRYVVAKS